MHFNLIVSSNITCYRQNMKSCIIFQLCKDSAVSIGRAISSRISNISSSLEPYITTDRIPPKVHKQPVSLPMCYNCIANF